MKYCLLIFLFALFNCKKDLSDDYTSINIDVYSNRNQYLIGKKDGILAMESNNNISGIFVPSDIENKTHFEINITSSGENNNTYNLDCRLWIKGEAKIVVFCNFKESLKKQEYIEKSLIEGKAKYNEYNLTIKLSLTGVFLTNLNYDIPFLYYNSILIRIYEKMQIIYLEFNIDSYHDEPLFIRDKKHKLLSLDKCFTGSNKLNCIISKENLDIIANTENNFELLFLNEHMSFHAFEYVSPIIIKYEDAIKEDIYFALDKLQENIVDVHSFLTFSTNITNLPKIETDKFNINFDNYSTNCYFIKHNESEPLYLTCHASEEISDFIIGEIDGFNKSNIHYKYNFILVPGRNDDKISITYPEGSHIFHVYPENLDFSNTDILYIYFSVEHEAFLKHLRLNEEKEDLYCYDKVYQLIKCQVPLNHFKGKQNGYFSFAI